jgi:hypothetical protein
MKTLSILRKAISQRSLIAVLIAALFIMPVPARATGIADIITLLNTITTTLKNGIGAVLSEIKTVEGNFISLEQQFVWPLKMINQAKAFVTATIGQYRGLLNQIHSIAVESATLVNPSHLESEFRSATISSINRIQPAYVNVYSAVPPITDAQTPERNMMDMDDASAVTSLKTASIADQTSNQMLTLADGIEQQASAAAPGSAVFLTTQSQIANLESQAYLAKTLASELRLEATRLAHENALMKRSASHSSTLRIQMQQVLK